MHIPECDCASCKHFARGNHRTVIPNSKGTRQRVGGICEGDSGLHSGEVARIFHCGKRCESSNDTYAKEVLDSYIEHLACGLVNYANIFRPEVILLGGGVCAQGDNLIKPLQKIFDQEIYAGDKGPRVPILVAELENRAGLLGAAALLM